MPKPFFVDKNLTNQILRVNHAGEKAASVIYSEQLKNLNHHKIAEILTEMKSQEEEHLQFYQEYLIKYQARPSILINIWIFLSRQLGAITSITPAISMVATKAVEEVIENHYTDQYEILSSISFADENILKHIKKHREDEMHHKAIAEEYLANENYPVIEFIIKSGCKAAIKIATIL